ncbi:MAG: phosphotransacetylase family protein [Candidatus Hadarchaeales archaeon]
MRVLYVVSPTEYSGKTTFIMTMALKAKNMGKKIGYFKPIGYAISEDSIDDDVRNMKEILDLEEEMESISPVTLDKFGLVGKIDRLSPEVYKKIIEAYRFISRGKDILFIDGPDFFSGGFSIECSVTRIAKDIGAKILFVTSLTSSSFLDDVLLFADYCRVQGVDIIGVVLNKVPVENTSVEKNARSILEKNGLEVLGSVPENDTLGATRVMEIYEEIGGEILAGREGMNRLVRSFLIGAMTMDSALRYFQRVKDKLVIVGGDRTDIISAALETDTSAIIVTGNLRPSVKVLPRADEQKVPIILVPHDTYTTLQRIHKIVGKIRPDDKIRQGLAQELFEENVRWEKIIG